MKSRPLIVSGILIGVTILFAFSLSGKEAEVKWKKNGKDVEYSVKFVKISNSTRMHLLNLFLRIRAERK